MAVPKETNHHIIHAVEPVQITRAKRLFALYLQELPADVGYQGVDREMANFPLTYTPPEGALLLAQAQGGAVGAVGLRKAAAGICEMKRLYVLPEFRRYGIGEALATDLLAEARRLGYIQMKLDSLTILEAACALYRKLGFREIGRYNDNPRADAVFFVIDL